MSRKSLKENFFEAMKELLNNGGLVGSDLEEKAKGQSDLDAYLETPPAAPGVEAPPYQQRQAQPQRPQSPYAPQQGYPTGPQAREEQAGPAHDEDGFAAGTAEAAQGGTEENGGAPFYQPTGADAGFEVPTELTIISKNTIVEGNIRSFANIAVQGNIRGDVSITKDAFLSGKVVGALKCSNMEMAGSSIQGDVIVKGRAMLDNDSLLLGDMSAQYAEVNGKIKGNMDIAGKAEFRSDAVILGDIRTSAITVMDGANIQGYINTTFLRENADKVFPGKVSIGEEDFTASEQAAQ